MLHSDIISKYNFNLLTIFSLYASSRLLIDNMYIQHNAKTAALLFLLISLKCVKYLSTHSFILGTFLGSDCIHCSNPSRLAIPLLPSLSFAIPNQIVGDNFILTVPGNSECQG